MQRTIITHDPVTAMARVRFEHDGVSLEQVYNLKMVEPGSLRTFTDFGIEFSEEYQLIALDRLTAQIQQQIEEGMITAMPVPEQPTYEAPSEPEAPVEASE